LPVGRRLADDGRVPPRAAFSLLELLLVLAVVATLVYFGISGFSRAIEGSAVTVGAGMVRDCLAEARQDAVAQNTTVEVRIYSLPGGGAYATLQLHACNSDGTKPALGPPVTLPGSAVIDATTAHSSLVASTAAPTPLPDPADPRLDTFTRCFHFLPGGATDLAAPGPWTLTVRAASQANPSHFPADWACVTLDPLTGRAQVERP
jgi:uncharacterized protein (TIGR02596 family)